MEKMKLKYLDEEDSDENLILKKNYDKINENKKNIGIKSA